MERVANGASPHHRWRVHKHRQDILGLVEGQGMRCDCCEAAIPANSLRLICPPCADSMSVGANKSHLVCVLHGRQVGWGAWDNQPTRVYGQK